jgi:hypothetical protein
VYLRQIGAAMKDEASRVPGTHWAQHVSILAIFGKLQVVPTTVTPGVKTGTVAPKDQIGIEPELECSKSALIDTQPRS